VKLLKFENFEKAFATLQTVEYTQNHSKTFKTVGDPWEPSFATWTVHPLILDRAILSSRRLLTLIRG
jgi:hypothetical protein